MRTVITGTGSYLPEERVPSEAVEAALGFKPGFCADRLGISERRRGARDELSYVLGAKAAARALQAADCGPDDVDMVLFHCTFSEFNYPTPGVFLQRELGMTTHVPVLEVKAACTAFIAMLVLADAMIRAGSARRILLVSGERVYDNASTYEASAPLMGDGGAAAVVEGREGATGGLRWSRTWTNASDACIANSTAWDIRDRDLFPAPPELEAARDVWAARPNPAGGILAAWNGVTIFRSAIRSMGGAVMTALAELELTRDDVDHYLFHQANGKILRSLIRQYELPAERCPTNIGRYGNTSSATVPILLDEAIRGGRIGPGDRVVMAAFGAGFTWGAAVYEMPGD